MATPFTHLHLHSEYSFLDGFCRIKELAKHCKETGVKAVALTDHGGLYGYFPFVKAMKEAGVKPILGCEIYLNPIPGLDRSSSKDPDENLDGGAVGRPSLNHMTLLAKNEVGWRNLSRMISQASTQDFHYKPVVTDENLAKNAEGIICLSGCMTGRLSRAILHGKPDVAWDQAKYFYELFGKDNFFIEIHNHGMAEQKMLGEGLADIARRLNVPLVAANDVHYLRKEDAHTQDALVALNMGKRIRDTDRLSFLGVPELYFKNREEMATMFSGYEQALDGPDIVQERCDFTLDLDKLHYPSMPGNTKEQSVAQLRELAHASFGKVIDDTPVNRERIESELAVIENSGFADYFLIVADLRQHAIEKAIPVGPARGSAAGSLLAYAIGITDVDSVKHGLLFERFLNPERVSPPDIDMDFCSERRGEILEYIRQKYGKDHVSQVVTFMTYAPKSAIKDACRGYDVPLKDAERISKTVDVFEGDPAKYFAENVKLQAEKARGGDIALAIDLAEKIIGLPSQPGVHAAAVVITPGPIADYVPLGRAKDQNSVTMADMSGITDSGLLKLDILGLKTCTLVDRAVRMVKTNGVDLDIGEIPDNDPKTAAVYASGNSTHIFQVEDATIQKFAKDMPVKSLQDFAMATSLCRPGPMEFIGEILERVRGQKPVTPLHPKFPEVGADTFGILIYQEQVMEATRKLAGFSMGGADLVRRAMGKKDEKKMKQVREDFVAGCEKHNSIPADEANKIFDVLANFAGYGFNKSHAVAYAMLSWQTAYLKAHHPTEFFAAALSCDRGKAEKLGSLLRDAQFNGVECSPPDVNVSAADFSGANGRIFYGLSGIAGIKATSVDTIIANRPYRDFYEFCAKTMENGINARDLKVLAGAGALDSFGERGNILNYVETTDRKKLIKAAKQFYPDAGSEGSGDLFFGGEKAQTTTTAKHAIPHADALFMSDTDKYLREKVLMGFSFSRNPATEYLGLRPVIKATPISQLKPETSVRILALVESKERKISKKSGKPWGSGVLSDETGQINFVAWPPRNKPALPGQDVSPEFDILQLGRIYQIKGKVDQGGQLMIYETSIAEPPHPATRFSIMLDKATTTSETLEKIRDATAKPGGIPFSLAFFQTTEGRDGGKKEWTLARPKPEEFTLQQDYAVFGEIMALPGVSDIARKCDNEIEPLAK